MGHIYDPLLPMAADKDAMCNKGAISQVVSEWLDGRTEGGT